jgi:PAS domain S-box-containing protein
MGAHAHEARALSRIVRAVGSSLELREVLGVIVRTLAESTPANRCFVYLTEGGGERLVLAAASRPYDHLVGQPSLARGEGIAGWAAEYGRPVFVPDSPRSDPRFAFVPEIDATEEGWYLATPMVGRDGTTIGVVTFTGAEPGEIDAGTVDLLASAASLVAGPIENARLFESTRRFAARQAAVASLGRRALQSSSLDALMTEAAAVVAETLAIDAASILELLPAGDRLRLRAGFGWDGKHVGKVTVGTGKLSLAGYTLQCGEPVISPDIHADERFVAPPSLVEREIVSSVSVIVHGRARPFGVLAAHSTARRRFEADEGAFLQSVANVLSDAVERERTLARLEETGEALRAVVESSPLPIVASDREGRVTMWNPAAERLYGWRSEEALGSRFPHVPAELAEGLEDDRRRLLAGGPLQSHRTVRHGKGGSPVSVEIVTAALRGSSGEVIGSLAVHSDITERLHAEEALRRRDAILSAVGRAAERFLSAGLARAAVEDMLGDLGRAAGVSAATVWETHAGATGVSLASLRHRWTAPGVELIEPATQDVPWASGFHRWADLLARGELVRGHVRELPERERAWWGDAHLGSLIVFPVFADEQWWGYISFEQVGEEREWASAEVGALRAAAAILGAAIQRTHAEEALRRSEQGLAAAQEIAKLGSWEWDVTTDALRWSDETYRICGVEAGSFAPTPAAFHALIPPEDRELMLTATAAAFQGAPYVLEHRIVRPDGDVRHVREMGRIDFDETGQPLRMVGTILDLTEKKRADEEHRVLEAQMQHTQKLESLGILAGGIAHDFNNLLMGILGNAGLVSLDLPQGPLRDRVGQIETAAQRAAELTHQLLAYAGKARFEIASVDLAELAREMTHLLEISIPKKVRLTYELDEHLPAVDADPTQLRQVVMNLMSNAAEAIGDTGGAVFVRVRTADVEAAELAGAYADPGLEPGRYVVLEVEDTGAGMDVDTVRRIFDPFFTTKIAGRGLGLAVVLGIVRAHGGAISVASEPGAGTLVRILLPASSVTTSNVVRLPEPATRRSAATVLVADDDEAVRAVTKDMLERYGYRTLTARDGREALELYEEHARDIDLVLLDMTMPVMDGVETLQALRRLRPEVPVLLSSGHAESEAESRLGDERPSGFIQKPYRPADLAERVRRTLAA